MSLFTDQQRGKWDLSLGRSILRWAGAWLSFSCRVASTLRGIDTYMPILRISGNQQYKNADDEILFWEEVENFHWRKPEEDIF